MKYNFVSFSIVIFVFFMTANTAAQTSKNNRRSMHDCKLSELNLTDEQQKKLDELKEGHFIEASKLRDELDKMRIDKRAMMRSDNLDKNNILDLTKKMNELKGKIALSGDEFRINVYELLTDQQKQDFRKFTPCHQKMGKRMMRPMSRLDRRGFCK